MADKLTVGRIQQLSDKPAILDLSKVEVVKRTKPAKYTPEQAEAFRRALYAEGYAAGRAEVLALVKQIALTLQHQAEKGAHTYASENADHYRGFDAGLMHAKRQLERFVLAQETEKEQA